MSPLLHRVGVQITYSSEMRAEMLPPLPSTYARCHSFFPAWIMSCLIASAAGEANRTSGCKSLATGHDAPAVQTAVRRSRISVGRSRLRTRSAGDAIQDRPAHDVRNECFGGVRHAGSIEPTTSCNSIHDKSQNFTGLAFLCYMICRMRQAQRILKVQELFGKRRVREF